MSEIEPKKDAPLLREIFDDFDLETDLYPSNVADPTTSYNGRNTKAKFYKMEFGENDNKVTFGHLMCCTDDRYIGISCGPDESVTVLDDSKLEELNDYERRCLNLSRIPYSISEEDLKILELAREVILNGRAYERDNIINVLMDHFKLGECGFYSGGVVEKDKILEFKKKKEKKNKEGSKPSNLVDLNDKRPED